MDMELISPMVKKYLLDLVPQRPAEMLAMEVEAREKGFPIIGPVCGHLCYQISRMIGARQIFELGSGYGYSTAWLARAVKENGGGLVHHVVWDEDLSIQARKHLARLGLGELVRFRVGEAVETLQEIPGEFDLIFNDIDKEGYPGSLPSIKKKLRPGGVLIIDNMLWSGRIFDETDQSPDTRGVREFTELITEDPGWITSLVPLRDGMIIAMKI
jgi:predicted O-methyltransferase YrrM